jgi:8-oxo-dGTP diphosphatase
MAKEQRSRLSAYGLIVTDSRQILLCRLSPIVGPEAGKWTLPGGGVDFGEDPKAAVVREIKEETGLNARVGKLLDVDSTVFDFPDHVVHATRIIYQTEVDPGTIVVESEGSTDAVDWFTADQLKHLPMVSLAQKGLRLAGLIGGKDGRDKYDLSLEGLMRFYEERGTPRDEMTLDYLQELKLIHKNHMERSRWRLNKMSHHR